MTREEAIADIKHSVNWAKENDERWCDSIEVGSLELAIKALNQPEIIRCRDCIYGDSEGLMQIGDKFFAMYRCERSHNLEKGMFYCGHAIRREEGEQCQPKE